MLEHFLIRFKADPIPLILYTFFAVYFLRKLILLIFPKPVVVKERWPVAYHTVDIAVIKKSGDDLVVLLGQKESEIGGNFWRLPGGFTDPELDISTEGAAARELKEETNLTLNITPKDYAGSLKVDDPRYRDKEDKIISSLFIHFVEDGKESTIDLLGGDDLKEVRWLLINENLRSLTNPIHLPFIEEVIKRYDNKKVC